MKKYNVHDFTRDNEYILYKVFRDDNKGIYKNIVEGWRIDMIDNLGRITELSMELDRKSKILNFFAGTWPINGRIFDFYLNEENNICIQYEDWECSKKCVSSKIVKFEKKN